MYALVDSSLFKIIAEDDQSGIPALRDLLWRIPQGEPCTLSRSRGDSLKAGPPAGLRLLRAYDSGEAVGRPGFAT